MDSLVVLTLRSSRACPQAWWAMLELNAEYYRAQPSPQPLIFYAAIRWVTGSKSPLSAAYGDVRQHVGNTPKLPTTILTTDPRLELTVYKLGNL